MSQLRVTTKKMSGRSSRIIYLVFKNISEKKFSKSNYSIRVKEGNRVVHQADYHIVGPLMPGEIEESAIPGYFNGGPFIKQKITVEVERETHSFSVGMFG